MFGFNSEPFALRAHHTDPCTSWNLGDHFVRRARPLPDSGVLGRQIRARGIRDRSIVDWTDIPLVNVPRRPAEAGYNLDPVILLYQNVYSGALFHRRDDRVLRSGTGPHIDIIYCDVGLGLVECRSSSGFPFLGLHHALSPRLATEGSERDRHHEKNKRRSRTP